MLVGSDIISKATMNPDRPESPGSRLDKTPGILTAFDVFSGCGGLTLGLKQAGFHVIGAVEIDPSAVDTYLLNHQEVKTWTTDVRELPVSDVMQELQLQPGQLDLLAGCPPCEGFSTLRTLNGSKTVEDEKNDLVFEFFRFVKELEPKTIMMENVPGLAKDERFLRFVEDLGQLGYHCKYDVLNAAHYEVPQRRRRLILLASLFGPLDFAPKSRLRRTVRDVVGSLPSSGNSGDPLHDFPEKRSDRVKNLIRMIPKDGGSRTDLPQENQLKCHKRCDGFKDVYGRMGWDDVAPTITTGCFNPSKGRFLHPSEDRAITMREAALLQTFTPTYKFQTAIGKLGIARQIGNALPPEFIRRHAAEVFAHLNLN